MFIAYHINVWYIMVVNFDKIYEIINNIIAFENAVHGKEVYQNLF